MRACVCECVSDLPAMGGREHVGFTKVRVRLWVRVRDTDRDRDRDRDRVRVRVRVEGGG